MTFYERSAFRAGLAMGAFVVGMALTAYLVTDLLIRLSVGCMGLSVAILAGVVAVSPVEDR